MARTRASKPQLIEPEEESQEIPEQESAIESSNDPSPRSSITKTDAAKAALAKGIDSPGKAVAYIQKQFGIEMGRQHFSAIKSQQRKKDAEPTADAQGPASRKMSQGVEGYLAPPPKSLSAGEPDLMTAMETMKPLIAALGADKVKRLVDLMG